MKKRAASSVEKAATPRAAARGERLVLRSCAWALRRQAGDIRLRQAVESAKFPAMQGARVTASFGVASAGQGGLEALLKRADEALYAAKESGRNKVVLATEPSPCEAVA